MDLVTLGWNDFFARAFAPHAAVGWLPARVAQEHKHAYTVLAASGELSAAVTGRLLRNSPRAGLPAVGDWVAIEERPDGGRTSIHAVVERRTRFSRRAAGEKQEEQIVAANIDTVFLVNGLDGDFNPRRIERYLALARGSGAEPVVLLNKSDLVTNFEEPLAEVRAVAGGAPVVILSATESSGLEALRPWMRPGATIALLGSSGAGKSTLVNALAGAARQTVGEVRAHDDRGKHTTTRRELIILPDGTLLIDTPGMRELQLWDNAQEGLQAVFPEVLALAGACRFRDCRHETEPDCAVRAAIADGRLPRERHESFLKLRAELEARLAGAAGPRGERANSSRPRGRRIMRG